MGQVRLELGDCVDVLRTLDSNSIDAVVTDPPYGIDYQSSRMTSDKRLPKIQGDSSPYIWFLKDAYRVVKPGGCLLCFCRWDSQEDFRRSIELSGFKVKSQVIWDREHHGMGDLKASFSPRHDVIWFAIKGKFTFHSKRPASVIRSKRLPAGDLKHPNQKPVDLMQKLVESVTPENGVVLDPFMGVGTTGSACKNIDRNFVGIEIDEVYFDMACRDLL